MVTSNVMFDNEGKRKRDFELHAYSEFKLKHVSHRALTDGLMDFVSVAKLYCRTKLILPQQYGVSAS